MKRLILLEQIIKPKEVQTFLWMRFWLANDNIPICVVRFIGDPENCFNISTRRRPLVNRFFVSLPKSATNCENDCNSINCWAICLAERCWAIEPTRVTDNPTSIAGFIPARNKSMDKNIWPSVMLITLVVI